MKGYKLLYCAIALFILSPSHLQARENDTAFIENYKKFRQFVDKLPTYNLYFVPDGVDSRFLINEVEPEMRETYHFLRRKTIVKKNAEFSVAVLVDQLVALEPYSDLKAEQPFTGGIMRTYNMVQPYQVSLTLFVYAKGQVIEFPLCLQKDFKKEIKYSASEVYPQVAEKVVTRVVNGVSLTTTQPNPTITPPQSYMDDYAAAMNKIKLTNNDLKEAFRAVLKSYKNYYVDRID